MKKLLLFIFIGFCAFATAAELRQYNASYSSVAPVLDGKIDSDPAWEKAAWSEGFIRFKVRENPRNNTRFKALYTQDALYISAECMESGMDKLKKEVNFGEFWLYDVLELFFIPSQNEMIQLIFSAAGSQFDVIPGNVGKRTNFQLGWKGASGKTADRWTAEICVPFFLLGVVPGEKGLSLPFNLCRYSTPAGEHSTWSFQQSSYRQPEGFGKIICAPAPDNARPALSNALNHPHWISQVKRWGELRNDPAWKDVFAQHSNEFAALEKIYSAPEKYAENAPAFAENFATIEGYAKAQEQMQKKRIRNRLFEE